MIFPLFIELLSRPRTSWRFVGGRMLCGMMEEMVASKDEYLPDGFKDTS